mmetsp:Transcript_33492/g.38061  ORF Transcript_33492/g.38061 Transcript_33492/m.38061 type:complete len:693 (+) Transcript_33492:66-2144(+)
MNFGKDLSCLFTTRLTPEAGVNFLLSFINEAFKEQELDKIKQIYTKLPQLFFLIFGFEDHQGWIHQVMLNRNEEQRRNQLFDVIRLLSPINSFQNLFSLALSKSYHPPDFTLKLSHLPTETQRIIQSKRYEELPALYHNLETESKKQIADMEKGLLTLKGHEYYIITFFYHMSLFHTYSPRNFGMGSEKKAKPSITDWFVNRVNRIKEGDFSKMLLPKMNILRASNFSGSPFVILFSQYLQLFSSTESSVTNSLKWFIHYFEEFCINEHCTGVHTNYGRKTFETYGYLALQRHKFRRPNACVIQNLNIMVYFLQKPQFLFEQHHRFKKISRQSLIFELQKKLFDFFANCFRRWHEDLQQTVPLCDLGRVWMRVLTPWIPNKELDEFLRNNTPEDIPYYEDFISTGDEKFWQDYVHSNLGLYTVLLEYFLTAFSKISEPSLSDLEFLQEVLAFYSPEQSQIVRGHIDLYCLSEIAQGNYNQSFFNLHDLEKQMRSLSILNTQLNPFACNATRLSVEKIIINLQTISNKMKIRASKQKKSPSRPSRETEVERFIYQLEDQLRQYFNVDILKRKDSHHVEGTPESVLRRRTIDSETSQGNASMLYEDSPKKLLSGSAQEESKAVRWGKHFVNLAVEKATGSAKKVTVVHGKDVVTIRDTGSNNGIDIKEKVAYVLIAVLFIFLLVSLRSMFRSVL